MNIGSSVIDDLNRKKWCVQTWLGELVDIIIILRNTQLDLICCRLNLDEPTYDIASDVLSTLTLVRKFLQASQLFPKIMVKSYV